MWEKLKAALEASGAAALPPERLKERLGLDEARWLAVGAAPTPVEVLDFFAARGMPICEVWGMSETSCIVTTNRPGATKPGSVGQPVDGMELWIADDGELLVRGPLVMAGYRDRPDLTAQAIDPDGWLHTGDVGRIDDDGYLWIVDRKKELIINAAGKNMSPANIETLLKSSGPLIGQACVVGDRRPYIVALLVLDPDTAAGLDPTDADVLARVQEEVDAANAHLSRVEQVKRFRVLARRVAAGRRRAHADDEAQAPPDRREVRRRDRRALRLDSRYGMAERRLHGLQRVLGVNALFATAYGNVGSSIYYALGLVASFALGLTPVVFIITGFIFYLTAATYAEATAMYPEAGGSSSFARRAFNEFASFFAAWAQMLNYTITIAISAFFVPHYFGSVIGVDALRHSPADIVFGIGVVVVLSLVNVVGVKESAGVNIRWPWSTS